ncbi:hypothetical protein C7271_13140 [filamentous cyanobacterium CCP5]|nr:hypothetical protein C7271_13140 [filamentous cyanobacterium CCP5]
MRQNLEGQGRDISLRRWVLTNAFYLGGLWDLLTTFLGSLIILGSVTFISLGLSLVGAVTVGAFNLSTQAIWGQRQVTRRQVIVLRVIWLFAIAFDFWTSLTCNATYVALETFKPGQADSLIRLLSQLTGGQILIVMFVTILSTFSPMMVSSLRNRDIDGLP